MRPVTDPPSLTTGTAARAPRPRAWGAHPLFVTWCLTRLGLLLLIIVPAERNMTVDVRYYLDAATNLLAGHEVSDWEYPFLALVVVLAPALFGFSDPSSYLVGFACISLVLDFLTYVSIVGSTRHSQQPGGAWLWVAGPPLLGLISITRLDLASCCAAAAGTRLVITGRHPRLAGALLAVGAAIKVWPAFVLVVGLALTRRIQLAVGAAAVGALTVITVFAFGWGSMLTGFVTYQIDRGVQIESVAALPLLWLEQMGVANYTTDFDFGAQQVYGPFVGSITWLMSAGFALGAVALAVLNGRRPPPRDPIEHLLLMATAVVLVLILTNKALSPQYLLWVLVMTALLGAVSNRLDARVTAPLLGALVLSHLLFPYLYADLLRFELLPLVVITARDVLLIAVLFGLIRLIRSERTA